jgi:integrase
MLRRQHGFRATWITASSDDYSVQIIDPDGRVALELSQFFRDLSRFIAIGTARRYVSALLPFLSWCREKAKASKSEYPRPPHLRLKLERYLREVCGCRLRPRKGTQRQDSFCVVLPTNRTTVDVRGLLTTLRHLYEWHGDYSSSGFESPLTIRVQDREAVADHYAAQGGLLVRPLGHPPEIAGIGPTRERPLSDNFYRLQEGEWIPQCIDDPYLPSLILRGSIAAGMPQRETCVTRLIFETGGRISEVTNLTILDWWATKFLNGAAATDKGRAGVRCKFLVWSQNTTKCIREYFDSVRREYSPHNYTIASVQKALLLNPSSFEDEPLFITVRGNPLDPGYYRRKYWKSAINEAGIDARPHQGRHWFTTNTLEEIDQNSESEIEAERNRKAFVKYMAWRSGDRMLDVYDHRPTSPKLLKRLSSIHERINARTEHAGLEPFRPHIPAKDSADLLFVLGEDK